jgi:hypothetical protein
LNHQYGHSYQHDGARSDSQPSRHPARLLDKLLIEQTKSRAHHSGDNGLVESKNGAIIRKYIGHGHIDAQYAEAMDHFHRQHLNPYINFHRSCAVPKVIT